MTKVHPSQLAAARADEKNRSCQPTNAELTAGKNADEMDRIVRETGMTFSAKTFHFWRPTKRVLGEIRGVKGGLTLIATDYNLGLFLDDRNLPILGHVGWFSNKVEPLFKKEPKAYGGKRKPKALQTSKPSSKSKRSSALDSI